MSKPKLHYEKPAVRYWTAEELDSIEATMSGGGGSYSATMATSLSKNYEFGAGGAAVIIEEFWNRVNRTYSNESVLYRNWLFFRALADFSYESLEIKNIPFSTIAGPYIGCDQLFIDTLHMTYNAMEVIRDAVIFAHGDISPIDFPHMCIVVSTHLAIELGYCSADALSSLGVETSQLVRDMAGWLGDATSGESKISFPASDSKADMDAVNIAKMAISGYSAGYIIRSYYATVVSDSFRAVRFKANTYPARSNYVDLIVFFYVKFGIAPEHVQWYDDTGKLDYIRTIFGEVYTNFLSLL